MKLLAHAFLFSSLWLILCGCPPQDYAVDEMKELRANHYDFKDWKRTNYRGIYFDIPKSFTSGQPDYMYKKDGMSRASYPLGVYLSVEKFNKAEAEEFLFSYDEGTSPLIAVHDFYTAQRRNSLQYLESSVKTYLPKGAALDGSLEVIYGRRDEYGNDLKYMIATIEKNNAWYVFQFISSHEMSAYLFDDFKRIIKSAK